MNTRRGRANEVSRDHELVITSPANPRIKAIRALRNRRERDDTKRFFIEGFHVVQEAVELHGAVEQIVIAPDLLPTKGHEFVRRLRQSGIPCLEVSAPVFETISSRDGPQGLAAVLQQRWTPLDRCAPTGRWIALESVQYPGNLGTILRTADATGCAGIILLGDATDPYDPVAVRASTGAILTQTLVRASFATFADWTRRHNLFVLGTSPVASTSYQDVHYREPLVLCMGSERDGLSLDQQNLCDLMIRIPMIGRRDSLNLAVATAVVLYEIFTTGDLAARRNPTERHAAQPPPEA